MLAPLLFRGREPRHYLLAPCKRWTYPARGQMLAVRWRAILLWVTDQGSSAPKYLITLITRSVLPLWQHAPLVEMAGL